MLDQAQVSCVQMCVASGRGVTTEFKRKLLSVRYRGILAISTGIQVEVTQCTCPSHCCTPQNLDRPGRARPRLRGEFVTHPQF